jgi:anaerobic ribonucleoside-triphosphate reductase activating protein
MSLLRLFALAWPVTALGPGDRAVIWVAGCPRDCPGCISPEMQPLDAGEEVPVATLAARLARIAVPIEGVTISGGEPFDQAGALADLLDRLRLVWPEFNVLVYTGYLIEELRADPVRAALLERVDILADGPYRQEIPRAHPLTGSGNQRVHYLTPRGAALRDAVESLETGAMNLGLSRSGRTDMIIGVTGAQARADACRELTAAPENPPLP